MKKVCFLLLAFIALSCSPKLAGRFVTTIFFDYSKANEKNVFLSPDFYHEKYRPIGDLTIIIKPAVVKTENTQPYYNDIKEKYDNIQIRTVSEEFLSTGDLTNIIVDEVKKRGGDAYVNFRMNADSYFDPLLNSTISKYIITGFVIKRVQ